MKCLVNRHKFKPMVKQINPSISRKIIHKYDKIFRSPFSGNRCKISNIKMYKIKRCRRKGVTIIKGQFCLFCQNDKKYNQIFETELNLNDLEKLTTEDEIRMDDQDKHAIDQVRGGNGSNCKNNL